MGRLTLPWVRGAIITLSSRDENLDNRSVVSLHTFNTWHEITYVWVCVCTFDLPKTNRLTLLQVKEAVAVSFAATIDEGSAGLSVTVEVPTHCVPSTAALLHGQQAHVCWSCKTQTHMRSVHMLTQG